MKLALKLCPYIRTKTQATPPGPRGLPIIGSLPVLSKYKHQYQALNDLAQQYGNVFTINIGSRPVVVLSKLETIQEALIKKNLDFAGRPNLFTLQTVIDGRTMGGRNYGQLYKRHQEIAGKAMHSVFMNKEIVPIPKQIVAEANKMSEIFLSYGGQPIDPRLDLGLAAAGVMFRILFADPDCRDNEDCVTLVKYATDFAANTVGSLIVDFMPQFRIFCGPGIAKFKRAMGVMERLILPKLEEHRNSFNPEQSTNMTDALLKACQEMDPQERESLGLNESLLVEGTTQEMMGTGLQPMYPLMRWIILYMIAYPEVQKEIQAELDRVIGSDRDIFLEDRPQLPFTEACIYEIMRHSPMFPISIPHATTTDTELNGYFLAKDTFVLVNLYSLTRDQHIWDEPEKFNPHRFINENGTLKDDLTDKFYPFGVGKRRCFGEHLGRMETFLFLTNLLHKCQFSKVAEEELSLDGIPGTMLHPEDYQVVVTPRF